MIWIACAQDLVRPLWAKIHPVAINAEIDRQWSQKVTDELEPDRHIPMVDDEIARTARRMLSL